MYTNFPFVRAVSLTKLTAYSIFILYLYHLWWFLFHSCSKFDQTYSTIDFYSVFISFIVNSLSVHVVSLTKLTVHSKFLTGFILFIVNSHFVCTLSLTKLAKCWFFFSRFYTTWCSCLFHFHIKFDQTCAFDHFFISKIELFEFFFVFLLCYKI